MKVCSPGKEEFPFSKKVPELSERDASFANSLVSTVTVASGAEQTLTFKTVPSPGVEESKAEGTLDRRTTQPSRHRLKVLP